MMMPWIVVGWMRAIVGTLLFFTMFAFVQLFYFFSHGIYYGKFSPKKYI